jgi:hypothetical protein
MPNIIVDTVAEQQSPLLPDKAQGSVDKFPTTDPKSQKQSGPQFGKLSNQQKGKPKDLVQKNYVAGQKASDARQTQ